jgi:dolichol-phosphate mannosyltransferase
VNWPRSRQLISAAANAYARGVLGLRTRDATSGFRAWRRDALLAAGVLDTRSNGYGFQVENTWRAERMGLRVVEHPITFTERTAGASKMTGAVAIEAAVLVLRWRLEELRSGRPVGADPRSLSIKEGKKA